LWIAKASNALFNHDMSKPWGPHDVGGRMAGPIDMTEQDIAHWEWQIDAMVRVALSRGLISDFAELRDGIEQLSPEDYEKLGYYERWAKSLAYTLVSRGSITQQELDDKVTAIRARQEAQGLR
jgi:nitrile hydratase subunit beta